MENNQYLVCADYSRYNEKDERLFAGRTHYLYIPTSNGWKMNSLERKERLPKSIMPKLIALISKKSSISEEDFAAKLIMKTIMCHLLRAFSQL